MWIKRFALRWQPIVQMWQKACLDLIGLKGWKSLTWAVSNLIKKVKSVTETPNSDSSSGDESAQATTIIIKAAQQDVFIKEFQCLSKGDQIPRQSPLRKFTHFLDKDGLLTVGGRTSSTDMSFDEKHPLIIPKQHVATLLVRHYHEGCTTGTPFYRRSGQISWTVANWGKEIFFLVWYISVSFATNSEVNWRNKRDSLWSCHSHMLVPF